MKRAQSDAQKEDRKRAILAMARDALDEKDYRDIRLQDLAEGVGLVKGTFYRYFPTKQDLFMALYMEELEEWLADWSGKLAKGKADVQRLEVILLESLGARARLVRLIGAFPGDLEPELSDRGLKEYKRFILGYLERAVLALGSLRGALGKKAPAFLVSVFVLIQGCAPLCFPVSRVAALLRSEKDFGALIFGFKRLFSPLLRAVFAFYFREE
jgi:TetR/AcrR family transcriptional regulator